MSDTQKPVPPWVRKSTTDDASVTPGKVNTSFLSTTSGTNKGVPSSSSSSPTTTTMVNNTNTPPSAAVPAWKLKLQQQSTNTGSNSDNVINNSESGTASTTSSSGTTATSIPAWKLKQTQPTASPSSSSTSSPSTTQSKAVSPSNASATTTYTSTSPSSSTANIPAWKLKQQQGTSISSAASSTTTTSSSLNNTSSTSSTASTVNVPAWKLKQMQQQTGSSTSSAASSVSSSKSNLSSSSSSTTTGTVRSTLTGGGSGTLSSSTSRTTNTMTNSISSSSATVPLPVASVPVPPPPTREEYEQLKQELREANDTILALVEKCEMMIMERDKEVAEVMHELTIDRPIDPWAALAARVSLDTTVLLAAGANLPASNLTIITDKAAYYTNKADEERQHVHQQVERIEQEWENVIESIRIDLQIPSVLDPKESGLDPDVIAAVKDMEREMKIGTSNEPLTFTLSSPSRSNSPAKTRTVTTEDTENNQKESTIQTSTIPSKPQF